MSINVELLSQLFLKTRNIQKMFTIVGYSKDYLEACVNKGKEYFQYEEYKVLVDGRNQDYEIISKIGRGKYSDVYKSINIISQQQFAIKVLKPTRQSKICRQVKILKELPYHKNIIHLAAVLRDPSSKTYCLAFQYLDSKDTLETLWQISIPTMKKYLLEIIKALQHCHSNGIIHRDIKPQNILINNETGVVKLIDFGLAEYYLPGREYNVRVASRYYKAPELFLNNGYYHYGLDMWSFGILLASVIFKQRAFINGKDNKDQFQKILDIFGNGDIQRYIYAYKLQPLEEIKALIRQKNRRKIKLSEFVDENNTMRADKAAIDLLNKLLVVDHNLRITAEQAKQHPFFEGIK